MNYRTMSLLALLAASAAQATTYYAASNGAADADCLTPQTAGTLDLAVSKARADGDIVQLAAGDYDRSATPVTLSVAGITLKGATDDPTQTVLIGPGTAKSMTGVVVTKKATVRDLTIRNFRITGHGGAAAAGANASKTPASNLTAVNCRIENNTTTANRNYTCGAVYGGTWKNCVFSGNASQDSNAGAANGGTYNNCIFTNNTAAYYAGALYNGTAIDCLFIDNKTTKSGCGFGATFAGTARSCTFVRNTSFFGGAGGANGSDKAYFYDCFFTNNTATSTGHGGALYGAGNANVIASNCVFIGNSSTLAAGTGGAGRYGSYTDCVFIGNKTGNNGSGGALEAGIATRCLFVGNSARHGSGTHNTTANFCIYSNNVSLTTYDGTGVALYQGKALNCLIVNNRTTRQNTGIIKGAVLVNCTIVGNTVKTASHGAATDGTYTNCLFMSNTMDIAGGTHVHSLYKTKTGSPTLRDCLQKTDAKFNAGANASLPYYALRGKSPAKDAGIDAGWTDASLDLLGKKRLVGTVDIGCYEYSPGGFRLFVQ